MSDPQNPTPRPDPETGAGLPGIPVPGDASSFFDPADTGTPDSTPTDADVEKAVNTAVLGEFFAKHDVARTLFAVAKEFEQLAMSRDFSSDATATPELRSMLYCLLDYWEVDRVMFSSVLKDS